MPLDVFLAHATSSALAAAAVLCLLCAWATLRAAAGPNRRCQRSARPWAAALAALALLPLLTAAAQPAPVVGLAIAFGCIGLAPVLSVWRHVRALRLAWRQELESWQRDALTGLLTRRAFTESVLGAQPAAAGGALVMLDIDHFKRINDCHLHAGGDAVLAHAAGQIAAAVRLSTDRVARLGGEEFCVLLPGASAAQAAELAERLVRDARSQRVLLPDGSGVGYTLSAGSAAVATWPRDEAALSHWLQRADAALYQAKRGGRDRAESDRSDPSGQRADDAVSPPSRLAAASLHTA